MSKQPEQSLSQRFQDLTPHQRQILVEAMRAKAKTAIAPIPRYDHSTFIPQSYTQRRLWFLFRITPDSAMYNMPECARLTGPIELEHFNGAFNDVLERHSSLRTVFTDTEHGPAQTILPVTNQAVEVVQAPFAEGDPNREERVTQMLTDLSNRSFDLENGPLVRMTLIRVGEHLHYLVVNMHHIISDGWSTGVFVADFSECYRARVENRPHRLKPLAIEFADFVRWQQEHMTSARLDTLRRFWRDRLAGVEPLRLPFDRTPTSAVTDRGGYRYVHFDAQTTARLKVLAEQWGATVFMALLAAFKGLLHLYSMQEDITVGVPVAGRTHPSTEDLIGFFANTAVIRTNLGGSPTFKELTERVRNSSLDAFEQEDTPVEMLVEMLQPERPPGRNPLFQVMFILQNTRKPALSLPQIDIKLLAAGSTSVKFDMLFEFAESGEGLTGWLGYRMDLFDEGTMTRFADAFTKLVLAVCEFPDKPLNQIDIPTNPPLEAQDFNDDLEIIPQIRRPRFG
jgi:hypothetical protein